MISCTSSAMASVGALVLLVVAALSADASDIGEGSPASQAPSRTYATVEALDRSVNAIMEKLQAQYDKTDALLKIVETLEVRLDKTPLLSQRGCFASPQPLRNPRVVNAPSQPGFSGTSDSRTSPSPDQPAATALNDTLHAAALRDDADALRGLLAGGADPDERNARGDTALHVAAQTGNINAMDALLNWGANPKARGRLLRSPLHLAAAHGHLDAVRRLVEAGGQTGARDVRGDTALALAAHSNHSSVFEFLLQKDASVQYVDESGDTILLKAAREGRWTDAETLAEGGTAATRRGRDGVSPLLVAARCSTKAALGTLRAMLRSGTVCDAGELAQSLAAAGGSEAVWALVQAAPELVAGSAGDEALRQAVRDGRTEALAALLAAGVDSRQRDTEGNTALQVAAKGGHTQCFSPILQALASVREKIAAIKDVINITTNSEILEALREAVGDDALSGTEGVEALKEAAGNGSCDLMRFLLATGVNASRENLGESLEAATQRGFPECVQWLREAGSPPVSGPEWVKKLQEAAAGGQREVMLILLAAGMPVDTTDEDGRTALMFAARNGHRDCVAELLKAGADKERMDAAHVPFSALMYASAKGRVDVVKLMLASGANVNAANNEGWTALMVASISGHAEVVEELVAAHAHVNALGGAGNTALHYAVRNNRADVVRVLLQHGADKSIRNTIGELPVDYKSSDDVRRLLTS